MLLLLLQLLFFILAVILSRASAQFALTDEAHAAYIRYNGSLIAHFMQNDGCGFTNVSAEKGSILYVGVYPDWDPNSLFFEIQHIASEDCNQVDCPFDYTPTKSRLKRQFTVLTHDDLKNLHFSSAALLCQKSGGSCSTVATDPDRLPVQGLNLNKAKISGTAGQGYVLQGDESTWLDSNTLNPGLDLQLHGDQFTNTSLNCLHDAHFTWNSEQNFNYTVFFSNNTASALFFLQTPLGVLEMQFNGSRVDYYGVASLYYDKDGHPRSINLDTSDPNMANYVWNTSERSYELSLGSRLTLHPR